MNPVNRNLDSRSHQRNCTPTSGDTLLRLDYWRLAIGYGIFFFQPLEDSFQLGFPIPILGSKVYIDTELLYE